MSGFCRCRDKRGDKSKIWVYLQDRDDFWEIKKLKEQTKEIKD